MQQAAAGIAESSVHNTGSGRSYDGATRVRAYLPRLVAIFRHACTYEDTANFQIHNAYQWPPREVLKKTTDWASNVVGMAMAIVRRLLCVCDSPPAVARSLRCAKCLGQPPSGATCATIFWPTWGAGGSRGGILIEEIVTEHDPIQVEIAS
jgi:hypothetical protein